MDLINVMNQERVGGIYEKENLNNRLGCNDDD